jgi:hypothetical protein
VSVDQPIASYDIASGSQRGARYTLYANRLTLHGSDALETVPLTHLAAVRVAFERDARKLNWAIALGLVALLLDSISGPLQSWMAELAAKVGASGGRESLESALVAVFTALGALARAMVPVALLLFAGAAALVFFFWLGQTLLTLSFAATERVCAVRGRDRSLFDFAELLAEQLAARKA